MLTRRKKTRPWLTKKQESLHVLMKIVRGFEEFQSMHEAFQHLGDVMLEHLEATESALYLYQRKTGQYTLQCAFGSQEVLPTYPVITISDFQQCRIQPTEFGMLTLPPPENETETPEGFLVTCLEQNIHSLIHIPLTAHNEIYGILWLLSKHLHHLTDTDTDFFLVLTHHLRLTIEKALLTDHFEQEVSAQISQLQESEQKYHTLFEKANDAIAIIDFASQRFLEVNQQAEELSGYSKQELLTMMVSEVWTTPHDKQLSHKLMEAMAKRPSVKLRERQIVRKDGSLLWVELNASLVEYRGHRVILVIARDISQRKHVELEKETVDAINKALISSHDGRNMYLSMSRILQQIFFFDSMEIFLPSSKPQMVRVFVATRSDQSLLNMEEWEIPRKGTAIEKNLRKGSPEIVTYTEDGGTFKKPKFLESQIQESLFFPLSYQEKIIGVLHFGSSRIGNFSPKHFTFLHRIAPQLAIAIENTLLFHKISEERAVYKHLIENVNELVFQVDPRGTIIFVNHRIKDMLGFMPEEIVGSNFFTRVIPEDLEKAKAGFRLTLRHAQPQSGEYRIMHKNGTRLTISIYTLPIFEEGRPVGMQGIIQNITPPPRHFITYREGLHELIGRSEKMQEIYDLIMNVASTDSTVLIHGESGTGKELIAQAVHAYSPRKDKPFIVVNCAAYSEHLLESELFGHERGAFTGAHRRKLGRFELAKGGSIFLDEVGEIPAHSQVLLLRVLQNKTFERVGGEKTLETEVRIIAATNKNLEEEMKRGNFREDLYYRLNVIPITVPPLRERKEDIPSLTEHFLKKYATMTEKQISKCSQSALDLLIQHDWYGNVRELENIIERAVVMASGSVIVPEDLPPHLQTQARLPVERQNIPSLYDHERQLILKTLRSTNWNKYQTAKLLGITRSTLYSKIDRYQLSPEHN